MLIGDRSGRFSPSGNQFLLSRPYFFEDDMTWCVRRAVQIPAWKSFFRIPTRDSVVAGSLLLFSSVITFYLLTTFEDHPRDIWISQLIVLEIVLLISFHFEPKHSMLRCISAIAQFSMMVTTNTFLAFFYKFLLEPRYEKPIDTFDRIATNNYRLAGDEYTKDYLMEHNLVNRELDEFKPISSQSLIFHDIFFSFISCVLVDGQTN